MPRLTFAGFLLRLVAALVVVFGTFNPAGFSYAHWIAGTFPSVDAWQAVAGVVLAILWVIFAVATARSIGRLGAVLIAALFAALIWLGFSLGWLSMEHKQVIGWLALLALAVTLAVGMSWSFVNRRLSGQVDTDEHEMI